MSKEDKKWINWQWERLKSAFKFWEQYEGVKYTNPSYFGLSSVEMSKTWQYCGNWSKLCHLCRDMHCQFAGGFTEKELKQNERIRHTWWRPITFRYFVLGQFKVQRLLSVMEEKPEFITQQLWDYIRKLPYRIFTWERPYNYRGEEWTKIEQFKSEAKKLKKELEAFEKERLKKSSEELKTLDKEIEELRERIEACIQASQEKG